MTRHRWIAAVLLVCVHCGSIACAAEEDRTAVIQFGGDVLIHQALLDDAYDEASDGYDFTHMLAPVADLLAETDLTVLNLEVPIAESSYSGYPFFNSPPALVDMLAQVGTDALLCANNHALDRLGKGARQTIDAVQARGMVPIGTARNREEYNAVPMFDVGGIQVAIFSYTQHTNGKEKEDSEENLRYAVHYFAVHRAERDIEAARAAGADYVIICPHWGKEYEREASDGVQKLAQALCEAGADMVIGGHPHVIQPTQWLTHTDKRTNETHETFVLYSMGNFLSGQREQYRDSGALFRFTLHKDGQTGETTLASFGYIPTWVWLEETSGRYSVVAAERALDAPPETMSQAARDRLRAALEETTAHLGLETWLRMPQAEQGMDTQAETLYFDY